MSILQANTDIGRWALKLGADVYHEIPIRLSGDEARDKNGRWTAVDSAMSDVMDAERNGDRTPGLKMRNNVSRDIKNASQDAQYKSEDAKSNPNGHSHQDAATSHFNVLDKANDLSAKYRNDADNADTSDHNKAYTKLSQAYAKLGSAHEHAGVDHLEHQTGSRSDEHAYAKSLSLDQNWDPTLHPRDDDGKFARGNITKFLDKHLNKGVSIVTIAHIKHYSAENGELLKKHRTSGQKTGELYPQGVIRHAVGRHFVNFNYERNVQQQQLREGKDADFDVGPIWPSAAKPDGTAHHDSVHPAIIKHDEDGGKSSGVEYLRTRPVTNKAGKVLREHESWTDGATGRPLQPEEVRDIKSNLLKSKGGGDAEQGGIERKIPIRSIPLKDIYAIKARDADQPRRKGGWKKINRQAYQDRPQEGTSLSLSRLACSDGHAAELAASNPKFHSIMSRLMAKDDTEHKDMDVKLSRGELSLSRDFRLVDSTDSDAVWALGGAASEPRDASGRWVAMAASKIASGLTSAAAQASDKARSYEYPSKIDAAPNHDDKAIDLYKAAEDLQGKAATANKTASGIWAKRVGLDPDAKSMSEHHAEYAKSHEDNAKGTHDYIERMKKRNADHSWSRDDIQLSEDEARDDHGEWTSGGAKAEPMKVGKVIHDQAGKKRVIHSYGKGDRKVTAATTEDEHEQMRILTMDDAALARRINKITHPAKMQAFISALKKAGKKDLAKQAESRAMALSLGQDFPLEFIGGTWCLSRENMDSLGMLQLSLSRGDIMLAGNPNHDEHGKFTSDAGDAKTGGGSEEHMDKVGSIKSRLDDFNQREKLYHAAAGDASKATREAKDADSHAKAADLNRKAADASDKVGLPNQGAQFRRQADFHDTKSGSKSPLVVDAQQRASIDPGEPGSHLTWSQRLEPK